MGQGGVAIDPAVRFSKAASMTLRLRLRDAVQAKPAPGGFSSD
jgi:hypothetical protein